MIYFGGDLKTLSFCPFVYLCTNMETLCQICSIFVSLRFPEVIVLYVRVTKAPYPNLPNEEKKKNICY